MRCRPTCVTGRCSRTRWCRVPEPGTTWRSGPARWSAVTTGGGGCSTPPDPRAGTAARPADRRRRVRRPADLAAAPATAAALGGRHPVVPVDRRGRHRQRDLAGPVRGARRGRGRVADAGHRTRPRRRPARRRRARPCLERRPRALGGAGRRLPARGRLRPARGGQVRWSRGRTCWCSPATRTSCRPPGARSTATTAPGSVTGDSLLGPWDLGRAVPFTAEPELFAAPLVQRRDGSGCSSGSATSSRRGSTTSRSSTRSRCTSRVAAWSPTRRTSRTRRTRCAADQRAGGVNWLAVNTAPCGSRSVACLVQSVSSRLEHGRTERLGQAGRLVAVGHREGDVPVRAARPPRQRRRRSRRRSPAVPRPGARGCRDRRWRPGGRRSRAPGSSCAKLHGRTKTQPKTCS